MDEEDVFPSDFYIFRSGRGCGGVTAVVVEGDDHDAV